MRYQVKHRYGSSTFGPWGEGDFIELDPVEAAWVNHDSPGTLEEIDPEKQARDKREKQAADEQARNAEREAKVRREEAERIHGVSQSDEPGRMDPGVSQADEEGRSPGGGQDEPAVKEKPTGSTTARRSSTRKTTGK